ncbi:uncharacterized protein VNE69_08101 [Vairimorpha necatrix]|uniref:Uncharacterized protein n=1 Tax=Vairimorpha necatrix TaxID=6039 RepID=A0AAX4JEI6_9MICR
MICFIFSFLYINCSDTLLVVPLNNEYVDIYIGIVKFRQNDIYIITELIEKDCVCEIIKTYDKRSKEGKNTKPYNFKLITLDDKLNIFKIVQCDSKKTQKKLFDNFIYSDVILKTTIQLDIKKTYFIEYMESRKGIIKKFATSEKLIFDGSKTMSNLNWLNINHFPWGKKSILSN